MPTSVAPSLQRSVLLAALLLSAPSLSAQASFDEQEIRRRRESSNAAIARQDTIGIAAILAPDLIVMSSTSAQAIGRVAHMKMFTDGFRDRPGLTYRRSPSEVRVFMPWRMASEHGQWVGSWREPDGTVSIGGTYFAKWRYRDGAWFVESETYVPERCTGSSYCTRMP